MSMGAPQHKPGRKVPEGPRERPAADRTWRWLSTDRVGPRVHGQPDPSESRPLRSTLCSRRPCSEQPARTSEAPRPRRAPWSSRAGPTAPRTGRPLDCAACPSSEHPVDARPPARRTSRVRAPRADRAATSPSATATGDGDAAVRAERGVRARDRRGHRRHREGALPAPATDRGERDVGPPARGDRRDRAGLPPARHAHLAVAGEAQPHRADVPLRPAPGGSVPPVLAVGRGGDRRRRAGGRRRSSSSSARASIARPASPTSRSTSTRSATRSAGPPTSACSGRTMRPPPPDSRTSNGAGSTRTRSGCWTRRTRR